MRCGVLCDRDGNVKQTWALVSDTITVPVEDGDHVTEWEVNYSENTKAALKEQERLPKLRMQAEVEAHIATKGWEATTQQISIVTPPVEPVYYGYSKGLHHRTVDEDGDVKERPVQSAHRGGVS